MRYSKVVVSLFVAAVGACAKNTQKPAETPAPVVVAENTAINSAAKLICQMHDRYAGKWY